LQDGNNRLRVLHTISGIWKHTGGPAITVPRLCSALVKKGIDVILATLDGPLSEAAIESRKDGVDLRTYSHYWQCSLKIISAIREIAKTVDIVHGHGLWLPTNWVTGYYAIKENKPFVITTRGALNPNALLHSRWKKKVAGYLFDNRNLRFADCIHVTSIGEYEAIRIYDLSNPVAVIPNGLDIKKFMSLPPRDALIKRYPMLAGKRILLFLSRISWEKGLVELAESWDSISPEFGDWALLIVGDGKLRYVSQLKERFAVGKGKDRVIWTGILTGPEKYEVYAAADLFVLPSHTENFSLVTAEALAAGVPVITTQGTPWAELVERECGWWVPLGTDHLTSALREAMNLSDAARQKMGENARRLIEEKYTWDRIAEEMIAVYRWMLHDGALPDCVKLD
jgi:glycosyltransferase involved in cell wall biosynthesis